MAEIRLFKDLPIGLLYGVIIPLVLIYLMEGIGMITFSNKLLPAIVVIIGALILVLFVEASKIVLKIVKHWND